MAVPAEKVSSETTGHETTRPIRPVLLPQEIRADTPEVKTVWRQGGGQEETSPAHNLTLEFQLQDCRRILWVVSVTPSL